MKEKITKQQAVVLDNLGVAQGVVERWARTLQRVNAELDRTALYDEDTGDPMNAEARLQARVATLLEDHLLPGSELMQELIQGYDPTQLPVEDRTEVKLTDTESSTEGA